jgi:hypothetical protein
MENSDREKIEQTVSARKRAQEFLLEGEPVVILTGNEFSKKIGITLTQQVIEYYNSIGGIAISPDYGTIMLDKQSVEDDFAHGIGRIKAIAYAAVPNIIEKGIVILSLDRHKQGEKTLSAMIAAPLIIGIEEYIGVVLIRQYTSGNKKLYVHEVFPKRKLLDDSSNPVHIPATTQGVVFESFISGSNPTQSLAANKGSIAKILQKIVSAKFI